MYIVLVCISVQYTNDILTVIYTYYLPPPSLWLSVFCGLGTSIENWEPWDVGWVRSRRRLRSVPASHQIYAERFSRLI